MCCCSSRHSLLSHTCFPVTPAVVSVVCVVTPRDVINSPQVHAVARVYRDLIGVMMPMQSRVALLPFVPVVVVLLVMLVTKTVIADVPLLLGIVPRVVVIVPVSFFVSSSIT